ncbi:hypothetical protein RHSIM_Rhsim08G0030800 [Rhododendron simsii]|uniref:ESF1 RRM domain-containing protein n=1 Tax=Rhododendron simsii TaxID=118357 RepID=A0A834GI44_RHOSS|nr:hypothetical protein RHSIM_Rhsim08G0030800 [Rhododendron simsii]
MGSKNKQSKNKDKDSKTDVARDDGGKKVITDPRFASVHSDPRFAKFTPHKAKVKIDSRFERVFTDKSFSSSSAKIDKRGKPKKDTQNPLKRYYRLEDEEEEKEKKRVEEAKGRDVESDEGSEESDSESEREEELKKPGKKTSNLELKNKLEEEESEEDEEEEDGDEVAEANDNSSTDTTDSEEENEIDSEEEGDLIPEENVPDIDKETHRLAVVNLDWSHVTAVDLFVLLSSFLPKGGQILSVAVYPSEFGLKRMEEEAVRGPVVLFDDDREQNESDGDHDDDGDDEIDVKKLREYELSRLRYYYAVVECDSIATADYLYKSCDGIEFERSSNKLDLRFIPDSMEFKHPPRDIATEAPAKYEGLDFQTRALQQSNIHLTWEEDEPQRAKALKRKFNGDQIAEMELKEFLASDESESDEDENDDAMEDRPQKKHRKQDMYRALLQSGEDSGTDDEDGQDMEVTFNTGLEDISKHALEKKDKKSETVWEAQLRKRREKKMARKNSSKYSTDDESSDSNREPKEDVDDFFVQEPSVKASKEGKGKSDEEGKKNEETAKEAGAASVAELELLLADGNGADASLKGYNLKHKKVEGKGPTTHVSVAQLPSDDLEMEKNEAIRTSLRIALGSGGTIFSRSKTIRHQSGIRKGPQKAETGRSSRLGTAVCRGAEPSTHNIQKESALDGFKRRSQEQAQLSKTP